MGSALVYVIVVGLVAAAVYLLAAFVFGRGEELAPMPPGATPTRLPARDLTGGIDEWARRIDPAMPRY